MPLHFVKVRQWVEEVATIEVEADTPEEALDKVLDDSMMIYADWSYGSDSKDYEVTGVEDASGTEIMNLEEILEHRGEF